MKPFTNGKYLLCFSLAIVLVGCGGDDSDVGEQCIVITEPVIGALWVPVTQSGQIQRFQVAISPGGEMPCPTDLPPTSPSPPPSVQAAAAPSPLPNVMGIGRPVATAFDSNGNLWVADLQMDRLLKFTGGQFDSQPNLVITPATAVPPAAQLSDPMGLAFDEQGNLWVSNFGQDSLVGYAPRQLNGNGEKPIEPAFLVQGTDRVGNAILSEPNGLTFSAEGNLWVANRANDTLVVYSPDQLAAARLNMSVSRANQPTPISTITDAVRGGDLDRPISLAFQSDGDLWVSNRGTLNNLVEFDKSGLAQSGDVAAKTTVSVPAPAPAALAFDHQGDLWLLKTRGGGPDGGLVVELLKDKLENGIAAVDDRFSGFGDTGIATSMSFDPPPANLPLTR